MRTVITAVLAAGLLLLAACGSGAPVVQGTLTDTLITDKASCNPGNGTLQVVLTNAGGTPIARDSAPFTWSGGACVVPFSFTSVPALAGYGIKVTGLNGGPVWLTPAQAGQDIRLRINAGYTVSRAG